MSLNSLTKQALKFLVYFFYFLNFTNTTHDSVVSINFVFRFIYFLRIPSLDFLIKLLVAYNLGLCQIKPSINIFYYNLCFCFFWKTFYYNVKNLIIGSIHHNNNGTFKIIDDMVELYAHHMINFINLLTENTNIYKP